MFGDLPYTDDPLEMSQWSSTYLPNFPRYPLAGTSTTSLSQGTLSAFYDEDDSNLVHDGAALPRMSTPQYDTTSMPPFPALSDSQLEAGTSGLEQKPAASAHHIEDSDADDELAGGAHHTDSGEYMFVNPYDGYILEQGPLVCEGVQEIIIDTRSFFAAKSEHFAADGNDAAGRNDRFVCDYCDTWFLHKIGVQAHIFMYHMGDHPREQLRKRGRRYKCVRCEKVAITLLEAQRHYRVAHNKGPRHIYKCRKCDKSFICREALHKHNLSTHNTALHPCPSAGCEHPGFAHRVELKYHIELAHGHYRRFVKTVKTEQRDSSFA